jgi:hypothetical protein
MQTLSNVELLVSEAPAAAKSLDFLLRGTASRPDPAQNFNLCLSLVSNAVISHHKLQEMLDSGFKTKSFALNPLLEPAITRMYLCWFHAGVCGLEAARPRSSRVGSNPPTNGAG